MLPGIPRERVRSDVLSESEGFVEEDAGGEESGKLIDATSAGVLPGSHVFFLDVPTSYWDWTKKATSQTQQDFS